MTTKSLFRKLALAAAMWIMYVGGAIQAICFGDLSPMAGYAFSFFVGLFSAMFALYFDKK